MRQQRAFERLPIVGQVRVRPVERARDADPRVRHGHRRSTGIDRVAVHAVHGKKRAESGVGLVGLGQGKACKHSRPRRRTLTIEPRIESGRRSSDLLTKATLRYSRE